MKKSNIALLGMSVAFFYSLSAWGEAIYSCRDLADQNMQKIIDLNRLSGPTNLANPCLPIVGFLPNNLKPCMDMSDPNRKAELKLMRVGIQQTGCVPYPALPNPYACLASAFLIPTYCNVAYAVPSPAGQPKAMYSLPSNVNLGDCKFTATWNCTSALVPMNFNNMFNKPFYY